MVKPSLYILGAALGWLAFCHPSAAQPLTGTTSLITIPTGELPADGSVTFSGGFVNKKHTEYLDGAYHFTPYAASVTFLPFLELGFRFSRAVSEEPQALGDRMIVARVQLLRGTGPWPAVVVGAHDFAVSTDNATNWFNTVYLVASKRFPRGVLGRPVGVHLGFGADWMEAQAHQFVGVFGGLSFSPLPAYDLLVEYDGEIVTAGHRLTLFDHLQLLMALQNMDTLAGGASLRFKL